MIGAEGEVILKKRQARRELTWLAPSPPLSSSRGGGSGGSACWLCPNRTSSGRTSWSRSRDASSASRVSSAISEPTTSTPSPERGDDNGGRRARDGAGQRLARLGRAERRSVVRGGQREREGRVAAAVERLAAAGERVAGAAALVDPPLDDEPAAAARAVVGRRPYTWPPRASQALNRAQRRATERSWYHEPRRVHELHRSI